ncbi:SUMO-activating enzyme subunit 2 [Geodia barretti]|uniref:SUMO-activating enzyme subunit 2 n=1 Tax=Geodia barretti TaxID=519541 RepID=A0AA35SS07_GEOBA|nr:SUMO-activating enzyme subunit 2 [Geodia barretti]
MDACLGSELAGVVRKSRVFVVGTGGIGCELAKNLVLTGFQDIVMIDLDTIEVSNLNRQFLFRKYHVGRPKVQVAREALLQFNPQARITAIHDSVFNPDYNVNFFKRFSLVMNALDNKAARNHVNRLCLAAGVTLIESGSAGYLGQVSVIRKGESECYECQPKPTAKTYPACSIRNTPSEPIHCIIWAKHLFNQLFGEPDADEDVSPDTEATDEHDSGGHKSGGQKSGDLGEHGPGGQQSGDQNSGDLGEHDSGGQGEGVPMSDGLSDGVNGGPVQSKLSTRQWAENNKYNVEKIFTKLYQTDVEYLLTMKQLWEKRTPPTPLSLQQLTSSSDNDGDGAGGSDGCLPDQRVWSVHKCSDVFQLRYIYTIHSLYLLKPTEQSGKGNSVVCSRGYFALICHAKHSFSQFWSITGHIVSTSKWLLSCSCSCLHA